MLFAVYYIENKIDKKAYIGVSNNPAKRLKDHIRYSKSSNLPFYNAIKKYKSNNFTLKILAITENENDCYKLEKFFIFYYRSVGVILYNISSGGKGTSAKPNKKTKAKISKSLKNRKLTNEHKNKISIALKGHKTSQTTKDKISYAKKGKTITQEHKNKIRIASSKRKHSTKSKQIMSEKGKTRTQHLRKINENDYEKIKIMLDNGIKQKEIAKIFNVSESLISRIKKRL